MDGQMTYEGQNTIKRKLKETITRLSKNFIENVYSPYHQGRHYERIYTSFIKIGNPLNE